MGKRPPPLRKRIHHWLQRRVIPPAIAWGGQAILHSILFSCRFKIEGLDNLHTTARKGGCFLMLWHDRLAIIAHTLLRTSRPFYYAAVVSKSRDGEILAAIGRTYRHADTIRVPHNARHKAVKEMIRHLKSKTILLITPDGPKGPQYKVKPGVAFTAKAADVPVIPFYWEGTRYWELPTWDRMKFPKPFSTIKVIFGKPVIPKKEESVENLGERLEDAMTTAKTEIRRG